MEINGENYKVSYDVIGGKVAFEGVFRLGGAQEYQPIESLLERSLADGPAALTLDFRKLEFLNSSGINVLYKFAIAARKKLSTRLVAVGSNSVPWQGKSLPNLRKFNNDVELLFEA